MKIKYIASFAVASILSVGFVSFFSGTSLATASETATVVAQNPCASVDPCAGAKNPCAGVDPCAGAKNPCASVDPCASWKK